MQIKSLIACLFTLCFTGADAAFAADLFLSPAVHYVSRKETLAVGTGATTTEQVNTSETDINGRLAFILPAGFLLGGRYLKMQERIDSTSNRDGFAYGPLLGFIYNGFHILGQYDMSAELNAVAGQQTTKYSKGTGFQVDVGFLIPVTSYFGMGPTFAYRETNYKKRLVGTTAVPNTGEPEDVNFKMISNSFGLAIFIFL